MNKILYRLPEDDHYSVLVKTDADVKPTTERLIKAGYIIGKIVIPEKIGRKRDPVRALEPVEPETFKDE